MPPKKPATPVREPGTKLKLALLTMALVTAVYAFAGFPQSEFGEFCFSLLGAAGIYSSARTAEKFAPKQGGQ